MNELNRRIDQMSADVQAPTPDHGAKIRAAAEQLEYGLANVVEELDLLVATMPEADISTLKGAVDYSAEQAATILQLTKPQEA